MKRPPDDTDPDATTDERPAQPRRRRAQERRREAQPEQAPAPRRLWIALGVLLVNVLLLAVIGAWWAWPRAKAEADPYPECAAIRVWLAQNTRDPARLEIIAWEKRWEIDQANLGRLPTGTVAVDAKIREANAAGGVEVVSPRFFVHNGRVIGRYP